MSMPDFTKRSEWPIYGDTLTFVKGYFKDAKKFVGVVSEWNVGGLAVWTVKTEDNLIFHVHTEEIINVERTGEIPEYIPKKGL